MHSRYICWLILGGPGLGFVFVNIQNASLEALKGLSELCAHATGTMQLKILQNFRWLHETTLITHTILTCTSSKDSH